MREVLLEEICQRLRAAPVQHIGRILVIYRPDEIKDEIAKSTSYQHEEFRP